VIRDPEFPDTCKKLPVLRNIFPVNLRRDCAKNDCSTAVYCGKIGLGSPEIAKFPVKFPVSRELAWRRVRSALPRQPTSHRRLEILPSAMAQMPANGGLLRFRNRSPGSQFGHFGSEIADSLRRTFEIFPFLGDEGRRPGSIGTAWRARQCNSTLDVRIG
jgi:hypothetical protein